MTDPNQNQQPAAGVSTPPNNGQVLDIANPESNDSTVSQESASAQTPTPQAQVPQTGASAQPQTPGQPQPQGDQTKQPNLAKAPGQQPQPGTPVPQGPSPAVQKASVFHSVAEALAGGPRYKYSIDEYGNEKKTPVPVSGQHLALAIAMEALGGAAAGFGVKNGPGNEGRAAAAGFEQGQKMAQQPNQQQKQQAQEDFSRRAQVTEMNMRLYSNARAIGKMDEETTDKYIDQYKDMVAMLTGPNAKLPGFVLGTAKYSDFAKYNVTADSAIPYKRVPRLGNDGKQVTNAQGIPQWDIDYLIVDPKFKTTGLLNDKDRDTLKEMGENWADNDMIGSVPLSGVMALNQKSRVAQWQVAKSQFGNFESALNEANQNGGVPNPVPTKDVSLPPAINDLAENSAKQYNVDPKFIKGLIQGESSGNPNNVSPTGATGLGQFTTATAKKYGLIDAQGNDLRKDPAKNADATAHYFSDLLNQYKDPKKAFAAYYSGPGAIQDGKIVDTKDHTAADTESYIDKMSKLVGLQEQASDKTQGKFALPSMADWAKDHPTFASDVEKFNGALNGTDGDYGKALAHLQSSGQASAANDVSAFLGGADNIKKHDDYNASQSEARKKNVENEAKLSYDAGKKKQEESGILERNQTLINAIASGKNIDLSRIATMRAYDREIIVNEILKKNPEFNPASIDRAIKLADEAADESKTGSFGNSTANVNTAYGHMGEASEAMGKLNQLEGRAFSDYANKPMSWMDEHFGGNDESSKAYQQWKVSLQAAATDWQNLLNNQHALTDHDKRIAETVANPNATFGNSMAALHEMARTAAIRTIPLNERWKQTMNANYPNLIQPQTIEALKKINDPVTNNYLKDLETGGTLVNGDKGVGTKGQRVGDLLGNGTQAPSAFKPGDATQYPQVSRDGKTGKAADGKVYDISTGQPVQQTGQQK